MVNNKELPHSAVMQKWFDNTWLYAGRLHLFGVISREVASSATPQIPHAVLPSLSSDRMKIWYIVKE